MSKSIVSVAVVVILLGSVAVAQDAPSAEIFGGYQFFRANSGLSISGLDNFNLNGWNAALNGYFGRFLGATADFSGSYGTPLLGEVVGVRTHLHTFMFGPVVRAPLPKITPFAHLLIGGGRTSVTVAGNSSTETDFTWAAGGGVDVGVLPHVGLRLAQLDFLQTRVGNGTQDNLRYSVGVVLKF